MRAVGNVEESLNVEKKHTATLDIIKQIIIAPTASEKYGIKKEPHRNLRALKTTLGPFQETRFEQ
jgi:hypothetical protein